MMTKGTPDLAARRLQLLAKRRMSLYLMLLCLIHLGEAYITFPFVGYTTTVQNLVYGLIVTAPFMMVNIVFVVLISRDLSSPWKDGGER